MQAEPELTATSLMAIISPSPSTKLKLMLRLPGNRCSMDPLMYTSSSWPMMRERRRSRSAASFTLSALPSRSMMSHALPKPTMSGTARVPDRIPRSCPPPSIWATRRTRGLLRRT